MHDEIILAVPEWLAREAAVILKETMIQAGEAYLGKVLVEVEVTIGETLGQRSRKSRSGQGSAGLICSKIIQPFTALFCLPVQANGADAFKLALCLISSGLEGVDARIVNTFHDEIMVEARDGIEDQVEATVKESM